jgi:hypothetical protein
MRRSSLFALAALAASGIAHASGTFIELQTPSVQITRISPNGEYAAGSIAYTAGFRWTASTGAEELLPELDAAGGVNDAGTLAGAIPENGGANEGGRDLGAYLAVGSAPVQLTAPLQTNSSGYDISADGTVVGLSFDDGFAGAAVAFAWTVAGGMSALPVNRPQNYSRANAISADAHVIAGWNDQDDGSRTAVIWTDGVPWDVVDADGIAVGEASAVSGDGRFVVGSSYFDAQGEGGAWRWDAVNGVQRVPGMSFAFGVSADGRTVVGNTGFFDDPPRAPMIWREGIGTMTLADYLDEQGIAVPDGWDLSGGLGAISGDARLLGGWAFGPLGMQSFLVRIDAGDTLFQDGFEAP